MDENESPSMKNTGEKPGKLNWEKRPSTFLYSVKGGINWSDTKKWMEVNPVKGP
jgi:hypothetical protein